VAHPHDASDDREASGWLVAWGCGAIPLTYVVAYVVVRLSHVLVNHGYRIHSSSGLTWWDVVFAPLVMLEQAVRGIG
jgi:hypothetical protein